MVLGDSLLEDALNNLGRVAEENERREQECRTKADVSYNFLSDVARDLIGDSRTRKFFDNNKEVILFDFPVRNGQRTGVGFVMEDRLKVRVGSEFVTEEKGFYEAFKRYSGIIDYEGIKEFLDEISREEILKKIASYSIE